MASTLPRNSILQQYVSDGRVDYASLSSDQMLQEEIEEIENFSIDGLSSDERLAFWLNAYNFITIKSVLQILEKDPEWKGVISLFQKFRFFIWNRHRIAKRKMSLYYLENQIIRKFDDPRIHFAINCASYSCPYLPGNKFEHETLDTYLEELTSNFINEQGGVILEDGVLHVSLIFKMYHKDFGGDQKSIIEFIRKYWKGGELHEEIIVAYQSYNWQLNCE